MSELSDAVQIMSVTGQGLCLGVKTGGALAKNAGKLMLAFLKLLNTIYLAKWKGKTSFNRFLKIKGNNMEFLSVETEDKATLRRIVKEMKKYGILTAKMPDLNKGDGLSHIIYSPEDATKVEAFLSKHFKGRDRNIKIKSVSGIDYERTGYDKAGRPTKELRELEKSARQEARNRESGSAKKTRVRTGSTRKASIPR